MIIIGYRFVSFKSKEDGKEVEFAEIFLGNKSEESKNEYGVQVERVTLGKKNYEKYNLYDLMANKIQVIPIYNRFGKCQGFQKV